MPNCLSSPLAIVLSLVWLVLIVILAAVHLYARRNHRLTLARLSDSEGAFLRVSEEWSHSNIQLARTRRVLATAAVDLRGFTLGGVRPVMLGAIADSLERASKEWEVPT